MGSECRVPVRDLAMRWGFVSWNLYLRAGAGSTQLPCTPSSLISPSDSTRPSSPGAWPGGSCRWLAGSQIFREG